MAIERGMVLSASSVISFNQFFHRNMTPGTCLVVTAIGMITSSVLYFFVQFHFLHVIKQQWLDILRNNKVEARAKIRRAVLEEFEGMSVTRSDYSALRRLRELELSNFDVMM